MEREAAATLVAAKATKGENEKAEVPFYLGSDEEDLEYLSGNDDDDNVDDVYDNKSNMSATRVKFEEDNTMDLQTGRCCGRKACHIKKTLTPRGQRRRERNRSSKWQHR